MKGINKFDKSNIYNNFLAFYN